ncbi:hypothetical protein Tco_0639592 [Tanacetum coccineum]
MIIIITSLVLLVYPMCFFSRGDVSVVWLPILMGFPIKIFTPVMIIIITSLVLLVYPTIYYYVPYLLPVMTIYYYVPHLASWYDSRLLPARLSSASATLICNNAISFSVAVRESCNSEIRSSLSLVSAWRVSISTSMFSSRAVTSSGLSPDVSDAGLPSEKVMASGRNGDDGDLLLFRDGPGACDISVGILRLASQVFLGWSVPWRLPVLESCQRKTGFGIVTSWREEDLIREIDLYMPIYQCRLLIFRRTAVIAVATCYHSLACDTLQMLSHEDDLPSTSLLNDEKGDGGKKLEPPLVSPPSSPVSLGLYMDPNLSVGKICLGEDNRISLTDGIEIKLCLEHEVKDGDNIVKKELIVALRGEIYFVKFIINPKEDDSETGVILGRSFMRLTKDDWELILDGIDFGDIPKLEETSLPSFVCKMGKRARNKKRPFKNYQMNYSDVGPSLTNRKPLTQEEVAREAIDIDIYKRVSILEEARPIIKTITYSDRYKKILDSILLDKLKLDGEIKSEEEEAIKWVTGGHEALKEKEDPGAFIILIRMEAKINLNALTDTGSDINVMPRTYGSFERRAMPGGSNHHYCKVSDSDMPVDKEVPILVGRGFLYTRSSILDTIERTTSTFDGICHQKFYAAKTHVNTEESDSDNDEDYCIKRNSLGAPIYGPESSKYLNCSDLMNHALAL